MVTGEYGTLFVHECTTQDGADLTISGYTVTFETDDGTTVRTSSGLASGIEARYTTLVTDLHFQTVGKWRWRFRVANAGGTSLHYTPWYTEIVRA